MILDKDAKTIQWWRAVFVTNNTGGTGYIYAKEWNWIFISYHIQKLTQSEWKKTLQKSSQCWTGQVFPGYDYKATRQKEK